MNKMLENLMLSCKKATELIERSNEEKLSIVNGLQLTMHTAMCSVCKSYMKQSQLIEKALRKLQNDTNAKTHVADFQNRQIRVKKNVLEKVKNI